jgi:hypothetical protein
MFCYRRAHDVGTQRFVSRFFESEKSIAQIASLNLEKLQPVQVPRRPPEPSKSHCDIARYMTQTVRLLGDPPARRCTCADI